MLIEQSGKDVIKKSFKIGVVLLMASIIYCWMVGYLPRAEMLLTPHSARCAIILFCAVLIFLYIGFYYFRFNRINQEHA